MVLGCLRSRLQPSSLNPHPPWPSKPRGSQHLRLQQGSSLLPLPLHPAWLGGGNFKAPSLQPPSLLFLEALGESASRAICIPDLFPSPPGLFLKFGNSHRHKTSSTISIFHPSGPFHSDSSLLLASLLLSDGRWVSLLPCSCSVCPWPGGTVTPLLPSSPAVPSATPAQPMCQFCPRPAAPSTPSLLSLVLR